MYLVFFSSLSWLFAVLCFSLHICRAFFFCLGFFVVVGGFEVSLVLGFLVFVLSFRAFPFSFWFLICFLCWDFGVVGVDGLWFCFWSWVRDLFVFWVFFVGVYAVHCMLGFLRCFLLCGL